MYKLSRKTDEKKPFCTTGVMILATKTCFDCVGKAKLNLPRGEVSPYLPATPPKQAEIKFLK